MHLECVLDMFARVIIASRRRAIPGRRSIGPPRVLSRASSSFHHPRAGEKRSTRPRTPAPLVASTHRDPRIEPNADPPTFPPNISGAPIELIQPETLKFKAMEPIIMLGRQRFANLDLRIRVKGGGHVSQMYAVRQAIAKAIVAYYQKYVDEQSKKELKDALLTYDRTLLVADPRRMEPKKFGGRGARARFQKSYR